MFNVNTWLFQINPLNGLAFVCLSFHCMMQHTNSVIINLQKVARPTSVYTFLPFYLIVLIRTAYSFVVYMYSIISVDCIGFDHTLFIILYSAIQLFLLQACQ